MYKLGPQRLDELLSAKVVCDPPPPSVCVPPTVGLKHEIEWANETRLPLEVLVKGGGQCGGGSRFQLSEKQESCFFAKFRS